MTRFWGLCFPVLLFWSLAAPAVAGEEAFDPEGRLAELGIELPEPPAPVANYVRAVRAGELVFLAGHGPLKADGGYVTGRLGEDLSVEEGYEAARLTAIALLASLRQEIGDLSRVWRIVKVTGMVNSAPGFTRQPEVVNGCSDLLVEVFGERGRHARAAVGMASLPIGIAVEIEMVVEVAPAAEPSAATPVAPLAGGDIVSGTPAAGATAAVLPWRARPAVVNAVLEERLDHRLPRLMREAGLDMWLVINREYAEDPVYFSLVPEPVHAARRTTMLVFHDRGEAEGVERLTVSRYPLGDLYRPVWEGGDLDEQWRRLGEVVREREPRRIGVDVSRDWAVADGLTAGMKERLTEALGPELSSRLTGAEELVVRWLETRTAAELELWPQAVALARGVIAEAFSERVITPGATTTDDVAWYIRERFAELQLPIWFMPYVNVQRPGGGCLEATPFCGDSGGVIRRGDVLHTDVGICYLRLCTDTQEMGYVLRAGETAPPAGLREALATGNRWQDLLTAEFVTGRPGNEILARARAAAEAEGILASVYTHPLGAFGHAPGPTVGMWDNQGPTPVQGDWPLHPDTGYAVEGNVKVPVPEWGGELVQIKLEQSAVFDGERLVYLAGRQTRWHFIR